jgi:hypothetical protein
MCECCYNVGGAIICSFSDGVARTIIVRGKPYYFDFSERFGPYQQNKDGSERKREWPKHVWDAFQWWFDQGKRMEPDGVTCIWDDDTDRLPWGDRLSDYVDVGCGNYLRVTNAPS